MGSGFHIGLDVGTTNITMTVLDVEAGTQERFCSLPNPRIETGESYAYAQDPIGIERSVRQLLASFEGPVGSICVTGQVHGILYHDREGNALSPLYTWLDRRAMEKVEGIDSQEHLFRKTGCQLMPGYGLLAHHANRRLGKVPAGATGFCGILEHVTNRLAHTVIDATDPSCLGPFGAFDPVTSAFDQSVLQEVIGSQDPQFLGASAPFAIAGTTSEDIPVTYPVGDNQAGFFGMVSDWERSVLVSMGTSGQISLFSRSADCPDSMELRPFLGEGFLHVGATLTAGKAYETLWRFIASVIQEAGFPISEEKVFDLMKEQAIRHGSIGSLTVDARFNGSRKDPVVRGGITNIGLDNLSLGNLVLATVEGIVRELHDFSLDAPSLFDSVDRVIATGSSVRKNRLFREALDRRFARPVTVAQVDDGAGFGAALIGAVATGALRKEHASALVGTVLGT